MLVRPDEGPPAGGCGGGADTGTLLAGEHSARRTVRGEVRGVTPAGAGLVMEGGLAGTGDLRALAAVTATGEVVLHRHYGGLTAPTSCLSVDHANCHVPGKEL